MEIQLDGNRRIRLTLRSEAPSSSSSSSSSGEDEVTFLVSSPKEDNPEERQFLNKLKSSKNYKSPCPVRRMKPLADTSRLRGKGPAVRQEPRKPAPAVKGPVKGGPGPWVSLQLAN